MSGKDMADDGDDVGRVPFNLNHWVWVRLTDHGRAALDAGLQTYRDMFPGSSFPLPEEDADGWSRWQLWSLMQDLGALCVMGSPLPFETTILLDASAISAASPEHTPSISTPSPSKEPGYDG